MVGGLKNVLLKAGYRREFETLFGQLRAEMRKSEPVCVYYSLRKSRTSARSYIVEEQYRDEAALGGHDSSAQGKIYFANIRAILGSITVEYFDGPVPCARRRIISRRARRCPICR
jgi:quinol monooxygenase YgiN